MEHPIADFDVSIVLPCLDESETLASCIGGILRTLEFAGLRGEIIVADNGSVDDSIEIAMSAGVKVVHASPRGYGVALSVGIGAASAKYVVMGDADESYDFNDIPRFINKLEEGYDLVIGNRFQGGILPGAMPWSHRWVGNPILSAIGRTFFRCAVRDFHCGIRAIRKSSFDRLRLNRPGMEFASEMIVRASLAGLRVTEIPTTLQPDGRSRAPHLNSVRDGWRHLKFMLFFCPRWLFFIPGLFLMLSGVLLQFTLAITGGFQLADVNLGMNTSLASAVFIFIGHQLLGSGAVVRMIGTVSQNLPMESSEIEPRSNRIEYLSIVGLLLAVLGIVLFLSAVDQWWTANFGDLPSDLTIRRVIPSVTLIAIGAQTVWHSLMIGALETFSQSSLHVGTPLSQEKDSQKTNHTSMARRI